MDILKVNNLVVQYDKIKALNDITFNIPEGKIVSFIGANGAGKSTLLNTISGLVPIKSGKIEYFGKIWKKINTEKNITKGICLVPEGKRLFPYLTVVENLRMGAFTRKDKKDIINDITTVLERFPQLKARSKYNAGRLSGGEQQILAFARGLMARPKLLMLDEPTIGIAPLVVNELYNEIKKVNRSGVTILLVEQNANLALNISDETYILETGKIILSGKSKALLKDERVKMAYLGG